MKFSDCDFEKEDNKYQQHTKTYVSNVIREFLIHASEDQRQVLAANTYLQQFEKHYNFTPGSSRIQLRWLFNLTHMETEALWDDCPPIFIQTFTPEIVANDSRDVAKLVRNYTKWIDKNIQD